MQDSGALLISSRFAEFVSRSTARLSAAVSSQAVTQASLSFLWSPGGVLMNWGRTIATACDETAVVQQCGKRVPSITVCVDR